ncbi:MAG: hypothetical protein ACYTFK_11605 [Planctomycetota bacterium]|jgi:hypothetical protein
MAEVDNLEGFRARTEQDDENEQMVRSIRGLSSRGIDYQAISDVIASRDLDEAISGDTILAKLAMHCAAVLSENMYRWSVSSKPEQMVEEHLESRAARLVVSWIESIKQTGNVSQQLIEQQDTEEHE